MPVHSLPAWPAGRPLRSWQEEAAAAVLAHPQRSFLASATPAAGKTTFGLHVAHRMLSERRVGRVCIVAPTTHIARQWAADAARYGLDVEPNRPNAAGPEPGDRHGVAVTYQTLAAGPAVHRRRCAEVPTLLIADEPHHMGDQAAWGGSAQSAFERARFRLLVSGTPFRSDNTPIPWITYDDDGVSRANYAYGYTEALLDGGLVVAIDMEDDDVLRTTEPGEALQLFADAAPAPANALAAFATTAPAVPASRHERREQLRDERRALVAAVSRRTGEAHRAIHGRINRETGAPSVTAASVEQLERGNRLLERQAKRR